MALTPQEIAASDYFVAEEYVLSKAKLMVLNAKAQNLEAAKTQFESNLEALGMDASEHYINYGAAENANPSNSFDNTEYFDLLVAEEGKDWAEVKAELTSGGNSPLSDFLERGQDLGYDAPAVPAGEAVDVDNDVEGDAFTLTEGRDALTGTSGADTFTADVGQNDMGAISNALSTGDVVNGGSGHDVLEATMINDNEVDGDGADQNPMPTTNSVEEIRVKALENVVVDADNISGEEHYASVDSRADLTFTNVDIAADQITKDITIEMKDTLQDSDLAVYFNEKDLRAQASETDAEAKFFVQLADAEATDAEKPLENVRITDLNINHDGNDIELGAIESTDDTYEGLVEGVQNAIDAAGYGNRYQAELGEEFSEVNGVSVVTGYNVVIVDTNEPAVEFEEEDIQLGVGNKLGVGGAATVVGDSSVDFSTDSQEFPVTADIILDGVGRGSDGGELVVGSTSESDTSTGIEVFDIEVRNDSVVHDISTTNDDGRDSWDGFQEINLTNGAGYEGDFVLTNEGNDFKTDLDKITATNFDGDIVLGREGAIVNLGQLMANVSGNVTYNADLNGGLHSSVTGSGNDVITMDLDGASVAINTGNGTNIVTLDEDGATSGAEITGGTGVDTIHGGAVSIEANTGGGDDVVYAENTGGKAAVTLDGSVAGDMQFLYGRSVKVTIDTDGDAAVFGSEGFESAIVDIAKPANSYLTTVEDLNEAVVKAINEDSKLSKIATASIVDDEVQVTYLVDGTQATDAVQVAFYGDDFENLSTTAQNAMLTEYQTANADSSLDMGDLETAYDAEFGDDAGNTTASSAHLVTAVDTVDTGNETQAGATAQEAVYEIDLSGLILNNTGGADDLAFGDYTYSATGDGEGYTEVKGNLGVGPVDINGNNYDVTYDDGTETVILTQATAADETADLTVTVTENSTVGDTTLTGAALTEDVATETDGVAEDFEEQTIDVSGLTVADGESITFNIDGTDVVYTNDSGTELTGDALEGDIITHDFGGGGGVTNAISGATYTFTNPGGGGTGDLTITQSVVGSDIDPITAHEGTESATTATGSDSLDADNMNTVNGGSGDDVIVLSSDDDGTFVDTVVYTDYNQGDDTLVHFESGQDKIDLSAYLTNTTSVSESEESQVDMGAATTGVGLALEANSASIISFSTDLDDNTEDDEFADFSAADLEAWLEEENNGVTTTEVADLYQDDAKSIMMVENDEAGAENGNLGEYKIFEVSYDNADVADDEDKDFTVKLIGTVDVNDTTGIAEGDIIA